MNRRSVSSSFSDLWLQILLNDFLFLLI